MTSKEALYLLMTNQKKVRDDFTFINLNTHEKVSIEECYGIVMKDLEVLEKLTKAIDILKEVLKRVFIFKFVENIDNGGYIIITKIDCNHTTIVNIRKEEYDLLKEVLEDDERV